jgi:hypothetical protein
MASTAGQMQTAFNVTAWDGLIPLYETDETVYIRSEYDSANQATFTRKDYTIVNNLVSKTNGSGAPLDADGTAAAGATAASVSTIGGAFDTAPEWPIFYEIVEATNPGNKFVIHESKILNLAGVNSVRDGNDWT